MFVQRAGKGIAIGATLIMISIGVSVRMLGLLGIAALACMALLGIYGGHRFSELTGTS